MNKQELTELTLRGVLISHPEPTAGDGFYRLCPLDSRVLSKTAIFALRKDVDRSELARIINHLGYLGQSAAEVAELVIDEILGAAKP